MRQENLVITHRILKGAMKPRILTSIDFYEALLKHNPKMAVSTYYNIVKDMIEIGGLIKIGRNLYANMLAVPKLSVNEIAQHLHPGSVVSVHSALTHAGALNNPSRVVTACIPMSKFGWRGGMRSEVETPLGNLWFFRMPEEAVICPDLPRSDVLVQDVSYPMATPEKALLDWIYMGNSPRINAAHGLGGFPPLDIDINVMDKRRLKRIAESMGMVDLLKEWQEAKHDHDSNANVMANMSIEMGF